MFQVLKEVQGKLRELQGYIKECQRVFQGSLKAVLKTLKLSFKGV